MNNFNIMNLINQMPIYELNNTISELKKEFNFDIYFGREDLKSDEKTSDTSVKIKFKVILSSIKSDKKISVLKTVKTLLNLGLKESKDLVEKTPSIIKQDIFQDEAEEIKNQLESSGGVVVLEKITI